MTQTTTQVYANSDKDAYGGPALSSRSADSSGAAYLGDSGGPLIVDGVQVGVAGKAVDGASPSATTIFAGVNSHRAWIQSVIQAGDRIPTGNLALNRPASFEGRSCAVDQTPAKAVDGRAGAPADAWCSTNDNFHTLKVDLGSTQNLRRIVIKHAGAGGESPALNTKDFVLYTSTDGVVWRTVDSFSGNTASTTTSNVNVPARFIKFLGFDLITKVYELEAYALRG